MTDDIDIPALRCMCDRALSWHGNPTAAQMLASLPEDIEVDRYGTGGVVTALEERVADLLGAPAAVFMPSGTMAQQIALRVHADERGLRTVTFHPLSHLELHEDKAYQRLHDLVGRTVGDARSLLTLDDLQALDEPVAAVLWELPQREIGGHLPAWEDLVAQVEWVRSTGAAAHLDGARLWESTTFYDRPLAEVAGLFDTVYVSFYKGLGGLAGCCLAGEEDVIARARAWRARHGGTLFGMWPAAASAMAGLDLRLPRMPRYVAHCRAIAAALADVPGVRPTPDPPHTAMMHLHLETTDEAFVAAAVRLAEEEGIFVYPGTMPTDVPGFRVIELTVGDATLSFSPEEVADVIRRLVPAGA